MAGQADYPYDVFISYSQADRAWAQTWLRPRLEGAGLRVVDDQDFVIGSPRLEEMERAVKTSRRTIVVLTPAWLDSEWNAFEGLLVRSLDPAARRRKLLPLLLQPCDPPEMIAALVKADLTVERHWERQVRRLVRDIEDVIPVPPPWRGEGVGDLAGWLRWLRRYRRALGRGLAALFLLWLVVSMALQIPPFAPRPVWTSLGLEAPQATQLARAGQTLLVGGNNIEHGCDQVRRGLWRSPDLGEHWTAVHAPLEFQDPDRGCLLADIVGFAASASRPGRIYAATSDVGLLRSDDAGQTWQRPDPSGLPAPHLVAVAVAPSDADRVFVAAQGGGLFRSDDGGEQWQRLDRQEDQVACREGQPLAGILAVGALLVTPDLVIVGTGDPFELTDAHVPDGLYLSDDGGRCWRQVDRGRGRDEYRALAYAPTPDAGYALILIRDWGKEPGENPVGVWRVDLTAATPERQVLWAQRSAITGLVVEGSNWYSATPLGQIRQGSLDVPARTQELPRLVPCLVLVCDVALAAGPDAGPPLLLAGGRVFRLQQGPWWRRWWP
ncbi:MAG: TIR domain-containing protein [Anaerolineae bacterium]